MNEEPSNPSTDAQVQITRIEEFSKAGQFEEALRACAAAIDLTPGLTQPYLYGFQILRHLGKEAEGVTFLQQSVEKNLQAAPPEILMTTAQILSAYGRSREAIECCRRLLSIDRQRTETYELLASSYRQAGRLDEELALWRSLLTARPDLAEHSNAQHVNFSYANKTYRLELALDCVRSAIEAALAHVHPVQREPLQQETAQLLAQARAHALRGDFDGAVSAYRLAVAREPSSFHANFELGFILSKFNELAPADDRRAGALEHLSNAVRIMPDSGIAYLEVGRILRSIRYETAADRNAVLDCFVRAAECNPLLADAHMEALVVLQKMGRQLESFQVMKKYMHAKEELAKSHPLGRLGIRILRESNTYAMGHLSELPEVYIKAQKLGWLPPHKTILLAPDGMVANTALLDYWRPFFEVVTEPARLRELMPAASTLEYDTSFFSLPDGSVVNTRIAKSYIEQEWVRQGRGPLLTLSKEDREYGWRCLEKLGVPRGAWFVAMHVREGGFKREGDCKYNAHRNCDVESYFDAVRTITARGGWVVRMGEPSMKRLPQMAQVVDYAHSTAKNSRMDLFLCAESRFFLSTSAGILATPALFGTPAIATNFPPTPLRFGHEEIFLPKLLWSDREQRHATFAEMLSYPILECEDGNFLHQLGWRFVDNTSAEIDGAVIEMMERLDSGGTHEYAAGDQQMQDRFRALLPKEMGIFISRIGRFFLRQHADLMPAKS